MAIDDSIARSEGRSAWYRLLCVAALLLAPIGQAQVASDSGHSASGAGIISSRLMTPVRAVQHAKDSLSNRGIDLSLTVTNDLSTNFTGGTGSPETFDRVLVDVTATFDTGKLGLWSGGTARARMHQYSEANDGDYVGDAQTFSNIDAEPDLNLYELWLEQKIPNHPWRIRGGIIDANTIFATVEHAGEFLNSSMGYSPTILHLPTYPTPRPGINAMFDGERNALAVGAYRTENDGWFTVSQVGRRFHVGNEAEARIAGGLWHLRESIQPLTGALADSTTGIFLVQELAVRLPPLGRSSDGMFALFAQYGHASARVSPFKTHVGTGFTWQALPWRAQDSLGAGLSMAQFGKPAATQSSLSEVSFEGYYKFHLTRGLDLINDLQYIQHPSGLDGEGSLVFTPRLVLSF